MKDFQINLYIESIDIINIETIKFLTRTLSENNKCIYCF